MLLHDLFSLFIIAKVDQSNTWLLWAHNQTPSHVACDLQDVSALVECNANQLRSCHMSSTIRREMTTMVSDVMNHNILHYWMVWNSALIHSCDNVEIQSKLYSSHSSLSFLLLFFLFFLFLTLIKITFIARGQYTVLDYIGLLNPSQTRHRLTKNMLQPNLMGSTLPWPALMRMPSNSSTMTGTDHIIITPTRVETFVCMFGCVYWYCCEVFDPRNLIVLARFCWGGNLWAAHCYWTLYRYVLTIFPTMSNL